MERKYLGLGNLNVGMIFLLMKKLIAAIIRPSGYITGINWEWDGNAPIPLEKRDLYTFPKVIYAYDY